MSSFVKCTDTLTINRDFVEAIRWVNDGAYGHRTLIVRMSSGKEYSWLDVESCKSHEGPACAQGFDCVAIAAAILGDDPQSS